MKIGCIGWWESSGVIATPHAAPLDSGLRRNDELGGRMTSAGGGIPTDAGMTRGMRIGCGWWESSGVIATTHTSPLDSGLRRNDDSFPDRTTRTSPLDSGLRRNDDWGAGMTSAGAVAFSAFEAVYIIFVRIARAGWCRHTRYENWCIGWWESSGVIATPHASPWIPAFAGMTNWGAQRTPA